MKEKAMVRFKKIALHGVPRSGTTWLGAILDSSPNVAYRYQPLFSYGHKSFLDEYSNKKRIDTFFDDILNTKDEFVLQKEAIKKGLVPKFSKENTTHIIYKEVRYHHILENLLKTDPEIKVIGIIRNPKSVISSWYNAPKEFNKDSWNLLTEWEDASLKNQNRKENFYGYNKWKEVAYLFLKLKEDFPKRFLLIKYSDLLSNTLDVTKRIFSFCELTMSNQTLSFLNQSKSIDLSENAYAVYRKKQKDNKWEDLLPDEIIKAVDNELTGTLLGQFNA